MIVLSLTKILQNSVEDPAENLTGTYRITVLSRSKILQNLVHHPS